MKSIWSHQFYETDPARGFVRGYIFEATRGRSPFSTAEAGYQWGHIPWGEGHHAGFRKLQDRITGLVTICEDLPEPHNRVTLDPDLTDRHGIPAPKVTYRLGENTRKMLTHGLQRGEELMRAAGAVETVRTDLLRPSGWHLLGTARMGEDPETSVVNPWGRSHDVKNLFIVDGSVFATAGGVNPTSTIQAVALHIGDRIKQNLANLFD